MGLDVGCGNGKYLGARKGVYIVGSDRYVRPHCTLSISQLTSTRSHNLTKIAKSHHEHDALVADGIDVPHPTGRFDFAISIAVIHHFSTRERRVSAVRAVLETLKASGTCLFFAWALEQKGSRRGWDENSNQDVMVPWVLQEKKKKEPDSEPRTFLRYYHLYKKGELEEDVQSAGGEVTAAGFDRDNWWVIARRAS